MAHYESSDGTHTTIILERRENAGLLAGILGCIAGLLGIFSVGMLFVPIALICGLIGLLRGIGGSSAAGIGTSVLASFLGIVGFFVSPSLWLVLGAMSLASATPDHSSQPQRMTHETSHLLSTRDSQTIAGINTLTATLNRFGSIAADYDARSATAKKKYELISDKMKMYSERASNLPATVSTERNKIISSLHQGPAKTDEVHDGVKQAEENFRSKIKKLGVLISRAQTICAQQRRAFQNDLGNACSRFSEAYKTYQRHRDTIFRDFSSLEDAYQKAKKTQEQIAASVRG